MDLTLIQRIDRKKIGIATSVAKEFAYDWAKTIEWARSANLTQIQFYINPETLKSDLTNYLKLAQGMQSYFHLPAQAGESTVHYCLHTLCTFLVARPIIIIQHQDWANTVQRFLPFYPNLILAIENDHAQTTPMDFQAYLSEQISHDNIWAVLDVPRFYMQAPSTIPFKEISKQIEQLLDFLEQHSIPFIIHAIDHTEKGGQRKYWRPFLSGDIPWLHFIKKIKKSSELLKCLLFEYENWDMTKESLDRIANS